MYNDPLGNRPLPQVLPPPYEVQVLLGDHGTLIDHTGYTYDPGKFDAGFLLELGQSGNPDVLAAYLKKYGETSYDSNGDDKENCCTITYIDKNGKVLFVGKNYNEDAPGNRYMTVGHMETNSTGNPSFTNVTEISSDEAFNKIMDWSYNTLNGLSGYIGLKGGIIGGNIKNGLYLNAAGEFTDISSFAKFNPELSFENQSNLSRAFSSYRSLGSQLTIGSRVLTGAIVLWDFGKWANGKAPIGLPVSDAFLGGMAEIFPVGTAMSGFLFINQFIPESPSSNFANPGRTPGHYAEWLH